MREGGRVDDFDRVVAERGHEQLLARGVEGEMVDAALDGRKAHDPRLPQQRRCLCLGPLAGLQLDQAGASGHVGGKAARHPIQIVRDAYGLQK